MTSLSCSSTHVLDAGLQRVDQLLVLERLVVRHPAEHGNDDLRRSQFPLIDHELAQAVQVDIVVHVEKRTRLARQTSHRSLPPASTHAYLVVIIADGIFELEHSPARAVVPFDEGVEVRCIQCRQRSQQRGMRRWSIVANECFLRC